MDRLKVISPSPPIIQNLKGLWDELRYLRKIPECSKYGTLISTNDQEEEDMLLQFLMGLNEVYARIRGQILLLQPTPSVKAAYSILLHEEKQRELGTASLYAENKSTITCDHCTKPGHSIDKCYRIHGFPSDFKFTKKKNLAASVQEEVENWNMKNTEENGHDEGREENQWRFMANKEKTEENGRDEAREEKQWRFKANKELHTAATISLRGVLNMLMENLKPDDIPHLIPLGHDDPSIFPCFRTSAAEEAIHNALRSAKHNCYAPTVGLLSARRALAEQLSRDLPYKLSVDDIFVTAGCTQSIEVILAALATPGANVLLPKPGFPLYEARSSYEKLECHHFDLIPEKGWEVDLDAVQALADQNTVAMVMINPGNPCGNVYTRQHLEQIAETARKLRILVISDEVYAHITFGSNPFVPMGVFGDIVPVITIGALSKRWFTPGWRIGWIATTDRNGVLEKIGIVEAIKDYLNITTDRATFVQGAVAEILEKNTNESFFSSAIDILKIDSEICYDLLKEILCITCPYKPEGSMYFMVKLNFSLLEDIQSDLKFCINLAKEESVIVMPASALGMKDRLRITFAIDPPLLVEGLRRIKSFCQRHARIN